MRKRPRRGEKHESNRYFATLLVADRLCIEDGKRPAQHRLRVEAGVAMAMARRVRTEAEAELDALATAEPNRAMRCLRMFDTPTGDAPIENEADIHVRGIYDELREARDGADRVAILRPRFRVLHRQAVAVDVLNRHADALPLPRLFSATVVPELARDVMESWVWLEETAKGRVDDFETVVPPPLRRLLDEVIFPMNLDRWRHRVLRVRGRAGDWVREANTLALDARAMGKVVYVYSREEGRWLPVRGGFASVCVADSEVLPPDFPPPVTMEDAEERDAAGYYTQTSHALVQRGEHAASLAYGLPFDDNGQVDDGRLKQHVKALEARQYRDDDAPFNRGERYVSHEAYLAWLDSDAWKGRRARRPRRDDT